MVNVISVGANPTPIWGMTNSVRTQRISETMLAPLADSDDHSLILANDDYVIDPLLLTYAQEQPALLLIRDGVPVLAKLGDAGQRPQIEAAMRGEPLPADSSIEQVVIDSDFTLYNRRLR